jgi:hypothetical protein
VQPAKEGSVRESFGEYGAGAVADLFKIPAHRIHHGRRAASSNRNPPRSELQFLNMGTAKGIEPEIKQCKGIGFILFPAYVLSLNPIMRSEISYIMLRIDIT